MIKRTRFETFVFWFYVAVLALLVVFFATTALSCGRSDGGWLSTSPGAGAVHPQLARTGQPAPAPPPDLIGPARPAPSTHSTRKELVGVHHREA